MMLGDVPGLTGLEIWPGVADGVPLYHYRESRRTYFLALAEFLVRLHRGEAGTEDAGRAVGFARAVFAGGEALHPMLAAVLATTPLPFEVEIETGGPYSAREGAQCLIEQMGWQRGVALDVGQVQLKVMTAAGDCLVPRAEGDAPVRTMIREGLAKAEGLLGAAPDGVALGLPVRIDRRGVAEPASYPDLAGPLQPLLGDLFRSPWIVLNDAVLTALGFPPRDGEKTLVVTLGFGLGAAIWEP